jgi:hypothetical protein
MHDALLFTGCASSPAPHRTFLGWVLNVLVSPCYPPRGRASRSRRQWSSEEARALTVTTLIVANLALIVTNLSWSRSILVTVRAPNATLWWVTGGALTLLGLILIVPGVRDLFGFALLHPLDVVLCLAAGIVSILWFEALKVLRLSHGPHARSAQ